MNKRIAGHRGAGDSRSGFSFSEQHKPDVTSPRWWWNSLTKAVLTIGGLATALAAVVNFWPEPDQEDKGDIVVVGLSEMQISEYQRRSISLEPVKPRDVAPSPATPKAAPTPAPVDVSILAQEFAKASAVDAGCLLKKPPCSAIWCLVLTPDAPGDVAVSAADAARHIATVLKETRTGTQQSDGKAEPLGVRISVNIELTGLRDKQLALTWSVFKRSGYAPLPDEWLRAFYSYRLKASTDHDTGTVDFWVPIPKAAGKYFVSVVLTKDGTQLHSAESPDFG